MNACLQKMVAGFSSPVDRAAIMNTAQPLWVTVVLIFLAQLPVVAAGLYAIWRNHKKGEIEDRGILSNLDLEHEEKHQKLSQAERDHVVAHYVNMIKENDKRHAKELEKAEARQGQVMLALDKCEADNLQNQIGLARMAEFLRVKGHLSEYEQQKITQRVIDEAKDKVANGGRDSKFGK